MRQERNNEQGPSHAFQHFISRDLLVIGAPLLGYAVAFAYEAGFCSVYRIPVSFISLQLETVLLATGALLVIGVLVFFIWNLIYMLIPINRQDPIGRSLIRLSAPATLLLIFILLYGQNWSSWVPAAALVGLFIAFEFVWPLFTQRRIKGYREKLRAQQEREDSVRNLFDLIITRIGVTPMFLIWIIVLVILVAHTAGSAQARRQVEFMVIDSDPKLVVLRVYGDDLITAPYDESTREVVPSFVIMKRTTGTGEPRLELSLEAIGPLTIRDQKP